VFATAQRISPATQESSSFKTWAAGPPIDVPSKGRQKIIGLAGRRRFDKLALVVESEIDWRKALRAADNSAAVSELRAILLNGLRVGLRNRTDVSEAQLEDFAQESLLHVLKRLDQFEGRSKFTTWAFAIAINTAFAELRRKRWQDVSLEALTADGRQLHEPAAISDNVLGDNEERTRLIEILRTAVAEKLSDKQRALILGLLQGMPFDQVVELLGTNHNSAYKLYHDARRALKRHLVAEGVSSEVIREAFAP
jgi:RNA polymerase sigma-70 factor, ECF subfamily